MTLPIDRSTLLLAAGNQVPYQVASATKNINYLTVVANTIDELNAKVDAHAASPLLPHADSSVTTAKIADGAVTASKIASLPVNIVGSAQIIDLSIQNNDIANGTITADKFVSGVITNETANGLQIVALKSDASTLSLNLNKYANFDTLPEYYDITTIVQTAMADLATRRVGNTGWRLFKVSLFIPGGRWKITKKRVFDLSTYGIPAIRGFNITGAGFENTEITFDNNVADADNFLIYNQDAFGFAEFSNIRFISANGVEGCIYHNSLASGNPQSIIYRNVTFSGFKTAISYNGNTDDSEMDYYSCKFLGTPSGGSGIYMNNAQSVNHNLYACEFETFAGRGINVAGGGCINVYGGSIIPSDGGIFLVTTDSSGGLTGSGNNVFNIIGARFEMNGTSKVFDIVSYVKLNFNGCNLTVERSSVGSIRGSFGPTSTYVTFTSCTNFYKYENVYNDNAYFNGPCKAHFQDCTLGAELATLMSTRSQGANTAGLALFTSRNCIINYTGSGLRLSADVSLNKEDTNLAQSLNTHTVFYRFNAAYNAGLPANGSYAIVVPLNAIIKKIRIVHLVSNLPGSYAYTVTDNLSNVLASLASTAHTVEAVANSADLWFRISSSAKQTLTLNQTGTNSAQIGYVVVEYI